MVEALVTHFADGEPGVIQGDAIRVECHAIGREDHDRLANRVCDRAQVVLFLPKLLIGALAIVDVGIDPIPADQLALVIVDWRGRDLESAILSIEASKADLRPARLEVRRSHPRTISSVTGNRSADGLFEPQSGSLLFSPEVQSSVVVSRASEPPLKIGPELFQDVRGHVDADLRSQFRHGVAGSSIAHVVCI